MRCSDPGEIPFPFHEIKVLGTEVRSSHSFIHSSIQVFVEYLPCPRHILGPSNVAVKCTEALHLGMYVSQYCVLDWVCLAHLYMHSFVYCTNTEHLQHAGNIAGDETDKVLTLMELIVWL